MFIRGNRIIIIICAPRSALLKLLFSATDPSHRVAIEFLSTGNRIDVCKLHLFLFFSLTLRVNPTARLVVECDALTLVRFARSVLCVVPEERNGTRNSLIVSDLFRKQSIYYVRAHSKYCRSLEIYQPTSKLKYFLPIHS